MPPMAQEGSISSRSRGERRSSPPKVRSASPAHSVSSYKGDYDDIARNMHAFHIGGQGLALGTGVPETFISMWLSALILHVHPKKQPRAIGFLIARHVRAIAHKVIRVLAENAKEEIIYKQLENKAFNHIISNIYTKTLMTWRYKATALRVARMRLRTSVSRWLRDELSVLFSAWLEIVMETRHHVICFDRIESRRARNNTKLLFQVWSEHMDLQDKKRNVLTRIVLRIQDRIMVKVMHTWFQLAGSLAIINHLAERGMQKYRANRLRDFFESWQDTRYRGMSILQKMDRADRLWHRTLTEYMFQTWFSNSRHDGICRERGNLVMTKDVLRVQRRAFVDWRDSTILDRHCNMVHVILSWRHARNVMRAVHEAWYQRVLALRCRFALLRRGVSRWCSNTQRQTFRIWLENSMEQQRMNLAFRRGEFRNLRLTAQNALSTWVQQTTKSRNLIALNSRVLFTTDVRLQQLFLQSWHKTASQMSFVRRATLGGYKTGSFFGAQFKPKSFAAWFNHTRENHRQESAIVRLYNCMHLRASYRRWHTQAIAWKRQAEKYSRMIFSFDTQALKTAWHGWIDLHSRTVIRANKLMNLMWKWDRSKVLRSWKTWQAWMGHRNIVTRHFDKNVMLYLRRLASNALYEWACVAFADAMLKRSGKRFAVLTILRNVGAVFKAWLQAAKEGRYFSRGMAKLGARQDLVFVAEHFSAWRDVMDDTSFKALTISRQDVKIAKWTVHNHFVSWLEVQQEVKDALKKHSRALVHMEFRLRYRCLHTWLGHERLQARLRNLNQRVNVSDDRRVLDISFGVWLTVQLRSRGFAAHSKSIEASGRYHLLHASFLTFCNEKCRLKKLRARLSLLIENIEDKLIKAHFEEWVFNHTFTARNLRLVRQLTNRYSTEIAGGFFAGWKERAKLQVQQAEGVQRLVMRVDCRLIEYIMDRWNINVHNEVMYRRQCMRMITRSVLFLARKVFNCWAYMAETTKIFSERCERFVAARNEVIRSNVVYWWHKEAFKETRRFEGLERCITRWQNKEKRFTIDMWWETIKHEKEMKKNTVFSLRGKVWRNTRKSFDRLKEHRRISRQCNFNEKTKARTLLAASMDYWVDAFYDMDYKRKNIARLVRRCELRVELMAFNGWLDELAYLRTTYGRAQIVQSRILSSRATSAVKQLITNAKARKRHRRLRISFFNRWYISCLKNFFESWHTWHGKKMAVKGVLDQVVDMM